VEGDVDPLHEAERISRYEIVRKLGEGGMGVVYQARDTDLGRFVALKFITHHAMSAPESIARFRKEARAISALNHTRIATIYGIEETNDSKFLVLEYLPGGTLRQKLLARKAAGQKASIRECLEWTMQIAEGLAYAHEHGIIHRDIKSSNVLFAEDGQLKIADFGLAKMASREIAANGYDLETITGRALGTPYYMSPEQASGREVDQRSDIFSLGVLLFESIAGEFPFRGTETPMVLHEIAYAPTPSLGSFRESVPEAMQVVIEKMLRKDPALRYQSARQLLTDLRAVSAGIDSNAPVSLLETVTILNARRPNRRLVIAAAAALTLGLLAIGAAAPPVRQRAAEWLFRQPIPAQKRIAVLPFTNIGGDPSMQALCDGLMEDVTGALTGLERFHVTLNVVPPSEVRKENITSAKDAGRLLGANLVVTGSVRRNGTDVDVWIGLSDTRTVTQLRSETFHARWPELAGMQFQVLDKVARMLELVLQPEASQSLSAGNTTVAAAYRSYVEGLGYLRRYDQPEKIDKAIASFQVAVAADPQYAHAYVGLAQALRFRYDLLKETRSLDTALEDASRALALNDRLAPAHIAMGMIQADKGENERAESEFQTALMLDPKNADAYRELASTYRALGRMDRAEATYKHALDLRHDDWWSWKQLGVFYFNNGQLSEAERCFLEVIRLTPDSAKGHSNLGGTYLRMGKKAEAVGEFRNSLRLGPTSDAYDNLGYIFYEDGNYTQAAAEFRKATQLAPRNSEFWGNLADAYRWEPTLKAKAPDTYLQAINLIQPQIAEDPSEPQLHAQLATWWAALGKRKSAESEISIALELAPGDDTVQFSAALVYAQAGQRLRALQAIRAALAAGHSLDEIRKAPPLNTLRDDPQYSRLVGSVSPTH
jgi:tetratricopeptide (TPR) repeat protein/tRNA A-37 threonylcarbamoyl transferase component Bud32